MVGELTKETDSLTDDMIDKEEKLSSLFKITSRIINEHEDKTTDMIRTLRRTRDEQVLCFLCIYTHTYI